MTFPNGGQRDENHPNRKVDKPQADTYLAAMSGPPERAPAVTGSLFPKQPRTGYYQGED